jgi:hypothetical protein
LASSDVFYYRPAHTVGDATPLRALFLLTWIATHMKVVASLSPCFWNDPKLQASHQPKMHMGTNFQPLKPIDFELLINSIIEVLLTNTHPHKNLSSEQ